MRKIDASIDPPLYILEDLHQALKKGLYYKEQLFKTKAPNYLRDFFEVEKILRTKTVKGKKFFFVKYLYYSNKFNLWVPESYFK